MRQVTAGPPTAADPNRAYEDPARVIRAFQAKPSYAAYSAFMLHLGDCPACADGTSPCAQGESLRRAWKAVRWS